MNKTYISNNFIFNFLIFILTIICIYFSPSLFHTLEFDSPSYIANDPNRLSFYPFIIDLLGSNNLNFLIILQIILMALSTFCLLKVLIDKRFSKYLIFLFFFLINLNFFYTSFSKTILTESFFFSFINFATSIILSLEDSKNKKLISLCFGVCIGCLIILRHEGLVISTVLYVMFFFLTKNKKLLIFPLIPVFFLILFENHQYKHEERKSVIERSFKGKIFMLSAFLDDNQIKQFENKEEYLLIMREKSRLIFNFLNKINNPFLKYSLISDYEGLAQYQLEDILNEDERQTIKSTEFVEKELLIKIIKKNPYDFFKLTLSHYLGLWMPGGKQIFLDKIVSQEVPYLEQLKKTSGNLKPFNKIITIFGLIYFSIIMVLFFFVSINYFLKIIMKKKKIFIYNLIILCHAHLIVISMLNIASTRYLMAIYPVVILMIFFPVNNLFKKQKIFKK